MFRRDFLDGRSVLLPLSFAKARVAAQRLGYGTDGSISQNFRSSSVFPREDWAALTSASGSTPKPEVRVSISASCFDSFLFRRAFRLASDLLIWSSTSFDAEPDLALPLFATDDAADGRGRGTRNDSGLILGYCQKMVEELIQRRYYPLVYGIFELAWCVVDIVFG